MYGLEHERGLVLKYLTGLLMLQGLLPQLGKVTVTPVRDILGQGWAYVRHNGPGTFRNRSTTTITKYL